MVNATEATISQNDLVTSNPPPVRLLTRSQVRSLVRWPDLIEAIAQALNITAMRTGAIAAVAARELAGPGPRRLALLGAGPVARQSLAALSQVVELEQVRVWSRDQGRSEKISFGTAMATAVGSVERAVAGAGIVLTATRPANPGDAVALILATAEHEQVGALLDFAG